MKPLTIEALKKLKPGDTVCIEGKLVTVDKVGRKYITLKEYWLYPKVLLSTGCTLSSRVGYCRSHPVWANKEDYDAYEKYCKSVDEARSYVRNNYSRLNAKQIIQVADLMKQIISGKEKGA